MNTDNKFKDRLRDLRKENKLTQEEFANKLGLVRTTVTNYELGRNIPEADILNMIADYFNVTVDYLLGRTNSRNYPSEALGHSLIREDTAEYKIAKDLNTLSPESQEEIKKLIELYKIKEMQDRNKKNKNEINGIG